MLDGSRLEACSRWAGWEVHKLYASAARHAAAWRGWQHNTKMLAVW